MLLWGLGQFRETEVFCWGLTISFRYPIKVFCGLYGCGGLELFSIVGPFVSADLGACKVLLVKVHCLEEVVLIGYDCLFTV